MIGIRGDIETERERKRKRETKRDRERQQMLAHTCWRRIAFYYTKSAYQQI